MITHDAITILLVKLKKMLTPNSINVIYLIKKKNKDGTWNMQAAHSGQVHFIMEKAGKPSRWNTLRMLRVMKHFEIEYLQLR